jgi:3-oxoacyl-[acyl-carrier protein] reductase
MEYQPKVVLITGCAKGIGRHLAECFYKKNYSVIATDIDFEALKIALKDWDTEGMLIMKLDVSLAQDWQLVMAQISATYGRLDICINNAGVIAPRFVENLDIESIDYQIDTNTKGVLYGTKFAAEMMIKQGSGHIINFSSMAGIVPIHGLAVYSASKHAVRGFTLSIVPELNAKGIEVSVICPALVKTDMLTLQLEYEAAAMTFSGNKFLTVKDIEIAVFQQALAYKKIEILVPSSRGLTAKIGNFFPVLGFKLTRVLEKKGLKNQAKLK